MKNLFGYTLQELEKILVETYNTKPFVAKQIWNWLYCRGAKNFTEMTNISKTLAEKLADNYDFLRPNILKSSTSVDGTKKWLLGLDDGEKIELVYIPSEDRGTLCISTQVGCSMGCRFCNTGSQGLTRNLNVYEMVQEVVVARDLLGEWNNINKGIDDGRKITNIVLMGMGEPLLNYDNVIKAIKIINNENGIAFSNRRITLSTCGLVPKIYNLANDFKLNLAISLHATTDDIRKKIMPIAEKYTMDEVMRACSFYAKNTNYRRITFEYIMIKDLNDSLDNAKELVKLVKKYNVPAKFNLIPFNYWEGCVFKKPTEDKKIIEFAKYITDTKYPCPVRFSRGSDIMAACGQLKSKSITG
ncbi:MAG: 23S rRNA (adenine(2503)-C(2))-methyltransferase RlmN [Rickettsiales bacterium]|jgi:23S rRNA (adenine2503-C2)-methyltransferase|nr:23S rRNA (adenine(2503)-C(2))-methyltransferase RlmN [Rickettsiales bacterium]